MATIPSILYRLLVIQYPSCINHRDKVATYNSGWFGHSLCDVCASGFHVPVEEYDYAATVRDLEDMIDDEHDNEDPGQSSGDLGRSGPLDDTGTG